MTIILPTLAIAFAAFCVWLTVRIINRRERWAKWTLAVIVALPVLYVESFGPACWWMSDWIPFGNGPRWPRPKIYEPLAWAALKSGRPAQVAIGWYANLRYQPGVIIIRAGDHRLWLWRDGPIVD
jgi:hypothetical protein